MQILFLASYILSDDDDRFTFKVFERFRVRRRFSATRITGSYHATYLPSAEPLAMLSILSFVVTQNNGFIIGTEIDSL